MSNQLAATTFGTFRPVAPRTRPADAPIALAELPAKDGKAVPMGCELLVRNIVPTGSATAKETLQAAHDAVYADAIKAHGAGALFPMVAHAAGRTGDNHASARSALLRMSPQAGVVFAEPRYDLVEAWIDPLRAAHPEWDVIPAPMSFGRDKRCLLVVHDAVDPAKLLTELKDVLTTTHKYTLLSAYKTNYRNSVHLQFQTPQHADEVRRLSVRVKSLKEPVRFEVSFQIDPLHVMEVGIKGISHYDHSIVGYLRSVCEHAFRGKDHPKDVAIVVESRVEDDYFLVTFRDWPTTARALDDSDAWTAYTKNYPKLGRPRLLFEINDMPNEKPAGPKAVELAGSSQTYIDERLAKMERQFNGAHADLSTQIKLLTEQNTVLTGAVREMGRAIVEIKFASHASEVIAAARDSVTSLMSTATNLRIELAIAPADDKPALQEELKSVMALLAEARQELDVAKRAKEDTAVKIALPPPPPPPPTPSKRAASPHAPDITPTPKRLQTARPHIQPITLSQNPSAAANPARQPAAGVDTTSGL